MLFGAVLQDVLAAAHEQQHAQASALATAQADLDRLAEGKQALQQRLQTNCDELSQSLQQLEGLKQDVDQREVAYKQQSGHAARLQSDLLASQQTVHSLQTQSASQANSISGDCHLHLAVSVSCQKCD